MGTPRQTFRIDEEMWREFQKKCAEAGFSASEVLRGFIRQVISGAITIESVKPLRLTLSPTITDSDILSWFKKDTSKSTL
ncbi:MAG: hypothetical protein QXZ06_07985 [Candidatus Jordarchaeales archaeon]